MQAGQPAPIVLSVACSTADTATSPQARRIQYLAFSPVDAFVKTIAERFIYQALQLPVLKELIDG